jgi:signal transduction histidine kinase
MWRALRPYRSVMSARDFGPAGRRALTADLQRLAQQVQDDSGMAVFLDVTGETVRLARDLEEGLYRVANAIMTAAWRHGRCSLVHLELVFAGTDVGLRVRDDGTGLAQRHCELLGAGFHRIRRAVEAIGGRLRLGAGLPHGLRLEVWVRQAG